MPITLFPFAGGINGHIDTRLLPDGALAKAENVELDRQGRLVGRAKYTALARTSYAGGILDAHDLFTLNDRLFAIGDVGASEPDDIFELVPSGLARQWRSTATGLSTSPRLPQVAAVREIARPPDQVGSVSNMGCAVGSGLVCLVWNSSAASANGYVFVVSAAENQPLLFEQLNTGSNRPCVKLRAVALSDRFLVIGLNQASTQLSLASWIFATNLALQQIATGLLSGGAISVYAATKVVGSDEFCVVANIAGTVTLRRYSAAGVLQVPSGGQYATVAAAATALAIEASFTDNQITIAMVVGGEARLFSYNLATGAQIGAGPHVPFSGETSVEVTLARVSATVLQVLASVTSETAPTIMSNLYTVATNGFAGLVRAVTDAQLTTNAVVAAGGFATYFGVRFGEGSLGGTPSALMSYATQVALTNENSPQVVKDLESVGTASDLLPDLALDASTGKYYWVNAAANPDGELTPFVTEFELGSTERRQTAQFGNLVYIAGGVPLVFDGVTLCESGFLERPRIISLTPSNGSGQLLPEASYDYRAHWEWIDSDGNLHLSPPSTISSVTLGASDDTVTAVVTSPHSLRRSRTVASSAVRCVLSRTLAIGEKSGATVRGTESPNPPSTSLSGEDLFIFVHDSAGDTVDIISFGVGDTNTDDIVDTINGAATRSTATNDGGTVRITTDETGEEVTLKILESDASTILGLPTTLVYGTDTRAKGENFQRTATAATGASDAVAAYVTVTDLTKDESDPIVDTDLIRQQVLYSQGLASGAHHAPPPCESIWASRERLIFARQPRRSRWTVSKLIVPAEPAEAAFHGVLAYSGLVTGDIEAAVSIGDGIGLFTRRQIWIVTGTGPNRAGQGEFFPAMLVANSVGLIADGWRSLAQDDEGVWFQGSDGEIYRLTPSGIEWLGREIQDYLQTYPVVTAACYVRSKQEVCFAVQASNGASGGILRYRGEAKAWFFDDVGPCAAMVDYQGRLAVIQAGVVLLQDAAPGAGTFVSYFAQTGMFQGFGALGWGELHQVGFLGTYRGPCTVEIFGSPDGTDFSTSLGAFPLTGLAVGSRVVRLLQPALADRDSFALKYVVTGTTDSEGLWLHAAAVNTERKPGFARLGASHNL